MGSARLLAFFGFLTIGIISRLLPHPPNFTALNAIALFGTLFLGSRLLSLSLLFLTLFFSDLILGTHSTMPFVYLSFGLNLYMSGKIKEGASIKRMGSACFLSSLLFFLITNFGVWMTGSMYPKTIQGLGFCYLAAIPFFSYQLFGDAIYSILLFGYWSMGRKFVLEPIQYL